MTPYKIFNKVNSSETLQRPCVKIIKLFLPRIKDLTIFKSNLVISSSTNLLLWNTFIWFHSKSQGYYSQNVLQNLYLKYFLEIFDIPTTKTLHKLTIYITMSSTRKHHGSFTYHWFDLGDIS